MNKHQNKEQEEQTQRSAAEQQPETPSKTERAQEQNAGAANQEQSEPQKRTSEPFAGVTLETTSEPGKFKVLNGDAPLKDSEGKDLTFKDEAEANRIAAQLRLSRPNDKIEVK